jgi:hypothetical protein
VAEKAQPITGRGIGYKLFVLGLIPDMSRQSMRKVYRLLKEAREEGTIPWDWIVDETRSLERIASWDSPEDYADDMTRGYRRDFWNRQPERVLVCSEKGTVRGVTWPVLKKYGVGFRVLHGFSSATTTHDIAEDYDGRPLTVLYIGDWDPSGMNMSEHDLPGRIKKYGGLHITLKRISLKSDHLPGLPSFPAEDKRNDPRYKWFVANYGDRCWELDAQDPNDLRDMVEKAIKEHIEPEAWERCAEVEKAERESIVGVVGKWKEALRAADDPYGDWGWRESQ